MSELFLAKVKIFRRNEASGGEIRVEISIREQIPVEWEIFSYKWHSFLPSSLCNIQQGWFSFKFYGKSEEKGDGTVASQWIFSFDLFESPQRGIIMGGNSHLTHKLLLFCCQGFPLESHKEDLPDQKRKRVEAIRQQTPSLSILSCPLQRR